MIKQNQKADLIVTDPPYLIKNTSTGSNTKLAKSVQAYNLQLKNAAIVEGITDEHLKLMWDAVKKPNFYFFCNRAQIQQYLNFFVIKNKCKWEILIWHKTNVPPLYSNKYLSDKEYILYFRKGARCNPQFYQDAKTVFHTPTNVKDKKLYGHPTIKPLDIVSTIIRNSSNEGDLVLDPFIGSGTTAVACTNQNRNYIGFEINKDFYEASLNRLAL